MKVYLRKLTNNDTQRQIETTNEAFIDFFGARPGDTSVNVSLTAPNSTIETFRISFANGRANSLRFANVKQGGISLSNFLNNNGCNYSAEDLLKISKDGRNNYVEIIKKSDNEYDTLSSLIKSRENTTIITDEYIFSDSIAIIANYIKYKVDELDLQQEIDDFISTLASIRNDFLSKFSLQALKSIPPTNLDDRLFGKKEDDSLSYNLCDNADFKLFGSAKQGNSNRVSWNGSDFIQYLESIENFINSKSEIKSLDEYDELWHFMNSQPINYYSQRIWVKKYLHILFPEVFVSQLSDSNKDEILNHFRLIPDTDENKKVFQLSKLSEMTAIPTDYFWHLIGRFEDEGKVTDELIQTININDTYTTNCNLKNISSYNCIFFGAPGTGKSFELEQRRKELLDNGGEYERVTFHPDYSYSQFVGTYKPVPVEINGEEKITYEYVPGPFMRILTKALINFRTTNPYLLLIEEINRANVAAVFGEVFQLLDRKNGISEYAITLSEDMKKYIIQQFLENDLELDVESLSEIRLPDNLFIWSSMNSADQGVFPMDTAFKRRWDFEYFGIDDNQEKVAEYETSYGLNWNQFRKAINGLLSSDKFKINEDKLMGPFFINPESTALKDSFSMDGKSFNRIFKNKVLMYLFDDAAKQRRGQLFASGLTRYSQICSEFDSNFDDNANLKDGIEIESLFDIFQEKRKLLHLYDPTKYGDD
ncbi:TPA: AAA family ATPase [Streptococcus suis]